MQILFFLIGLISLILGIIGIFLPVLPTVPFLLLATWCFSRSSKRMHAYIVEHAIFGPAMKEYFEKKIIRRKHKIISLASMWLVLCISAYFMLHMKWLVLVLPAIGIAVTIFILKHPSELPNEK